MVDVHYTSTKVCLASRRFGVALLWHWMGKPASISEVPVHSSFSTYLKLLSCVAGSGKIERLLPKASRCIDEYGAGGSTCA